MLQLKEIKKQYDMQDTVVQALKGIDIEFRKNEFVSILGPSGCGKTTLLNIIGGLDKYNSGDLIINGISTKEYTDKDWDNYRNKKIGFIFQSYNLIPHLTVLENVELALTLSGIGKEERRKRAKEVLNKVGLSEKLKNKPNQLSGGQMQRVAIARALVNDPEIILADEPTGALDSKTSVQIMEILKEISNDKLIIMVTHNPELAKKYSSRIIKLLDGEVVSDNNEYHCKKDEKANNDKDKVSNNETVEVVDDADVVIDENKLKSKNNKKAKKEKTRMGFLTAISLSLKNLLTKKARTFLVSFAGSIGIIGIALILSLSSGFQAYVDMVQKDTLSSYPVQLTNSAYNMSSLMQIFFDNDSNGEEHDDDKVYTKDELIEMLNKFNASSTKNDLKSFKSYIEGDAKNDIEKYTSAIQYVYDVNVNAYYDSEVNGLVSANLTTVFADIISAYPDSHPLTTPDQIMRYEIIKMMFGSESSYYSNSFWSEMLDNQELLENQYELIGEGSRWAENYNEIMIVVDENNEISDYTLYGLGLLNQQDLETLLDDYINNKNSEGTNATFEYADLLNLEYKIILECDYFEKQADGTYIDIRTYKQSNPELYKQKIQNLYDTKGITIKVAGIIKEKENAAALSIGTCIGYKSDLTKYIIEQVQNSDIVQEQLNNKTTNIITNEPFDLMLANTQYNQVLTKLGYADLTNPSGINLFPVDFESKKEIENIIAKYNDMVVKNGEDSKVITYSDTIGTMMESVTTIISAITYVLIAFVSISLIVSSIMIGIITYISVLERIKEIGVLRSIGASKRDIKRVFVSESVIIGFIAGLLGILVTIVLNIPINIIIYSLAGLSGVATLPWIGAIILVLISMFLTFIAGIIPARIASKKDPVIALRTE